MAITLSVDEGGSYSHNDTVHIERYLDSFPEHYRIMIGTVCIGLIFKTKDDRWVTTRTYAHRYSSFQNAIEGICKRLHGMADSS